VSSLPEAKTNVLVTGAAGFVGRNLCIELARRPEVRLFRYDVDSESDELHRGLAAADFVLHLAGVNRPKNVEEFQLGNAGLTQEICSKLVELGRTPRIVFSSSIQADRDNPYGQSKRAAEEALQQYCATDGRTCVIYRLKNLFGKWCRPNYNSVTATFCHNIAHDIDITVSNPAAVIELTYIDDVVSAFLSELAMERSNGCHVADPLPSQTVSLGNLAALIRSFRSHRKTLQVPDFSRPFVRALYATYLSYLPSGDFSYALNVRTDDRGGLAELLKSPSFGQIFVSRTKPGITRGNHYHHTKTEKFMVLQGRAVVRFRHITGGDVLEYPVSGDEYRVVDIPPGYTHSIENVGADELVTLFWASGVFDPDRPDTYRMPV